jgi:hypothetical protein
MASRAQAKHESPVKERFAGKVYRKKEALGVSNA